jgi:hypothetical protein
VGHEDGSYPEQNGTGGGSAALRRQLGVLRSFLESFSLAELRPDANVVTHAAGTTARVLANSGKEYAIYLDGAGGGVRPSDAAGGVTLRVPAGDYSAEWINVETGATVQPEMFHHAGGEKVLSAPKFENGIALRLKRVPAAPAKAAPGKTGRGARATSAS